MITHRMYIVHFGIEAKPLKCTVVPYCDVLHHKQRNKQSVLRCAQQCQSDKPAPVAQSVECLLRGRELKGWILGPDIPKSLKMVLAAPHLAIRYTE